MKSSSRSWLAAPAVASLLLAAVHCGSSDGNPLFDATDSGNEGSASNADGSSAADARDAAAADSASAIDAAAADAAPIPDGGVAADPAKVTCGATACDVSTSFCCSLPDGGGSCQTSGGACSALGGVKQECDEAANCPPVDGVAQVCCFEVGANRALVTACHRDCTGGGGTRIQACRTTTECLTGSCAVRSCDPASGATKVESCKPIPNVCP